MGTNEDADGRFEWYAHCPNGHGLAPSATVNLSADVMMRMYVCPMDGYVIVRTSRGERSVYAPQFFAERLDASRERQAHYPDQPGPFDSERAK